jgi:hypothetical protein
MKSVELFSVVGEGTVAAVMVVVIRRVRKIAKSDS